MNKTRKQNSTDYPICFFMADISDLRTGKTGLTPTVTLSKNGGAFAAAAGAVTEIGNGWYSLAGNADDRSTLGEFLLHAESTGADPADEKYTIESHDPFNLAEPGAKMDLIDAPNATAVTAMQSGLALDSTVMKSADYTAPPSTSDIASAVWSAVTRTLTAISDSSGITTLLSRIGAALTITGGKVDVNDKTGFSLATAPPTASEIAIAVEQHIISETDGELVLKAITDKIASVNPTLGELSLAAIASAVATEMLVAPANKIGVDSDNAVKIQKMPVMLAAADVSGNVPVDVSAMQSGLALDSTVMKSADYTAPPSTSDIASAVWSAVTRTLTAFSDSSGITTLLSRIGAALTITGGKVDINDKTGFSLADGQAMTAAKVVIDNLNNTIKLYNAEDELIVTYTKTVDGTVHTLSRS